MVVRRRTALSLPSLSLGLLLAHIAGAAPSPSPVPADWPERSRAFANQLMAELRSELEAAMQAGGPVADIEVDFHHLNAEHLPFGAGSFDTVVCTFTLCSIPDVRHALQEVSRVMRSGGRFLFLEHGLSPSPAVARWQRRLEPLQRRIGGGCHLTRDPVALVRATGLQLEAVSQAYMRATPKVVGYMTEGIALKP